MTYNLIGVKNMILTKCNKKPQIDPNGAGWPSKTGNNSGKGRGNNNPKNK